MCYLESPRHVLPGIARHVLPGIPRHVLPGIARHVLAEVGQQHGDVEANVLGRVVKAVSEFGEVDLAVLIRIHTHHDVLDLLSASIHLIMYSISSLHPHTS